MYLRDDEVELIRSKINKLSNETIVKIAAGKVKALLDGEIETIERQREKIIDLQEQITELQEKVNDLEKELDYNI